MIAPDLSQTSELLSQSLQQGAHPYLMVTSDSMAPMIRQGDEVQIAHANQDELTNGDITVVRDAHGFLAHRYYSSFSSAGQGYLILRGDRIKSFDPPYPTFQLVGRVVARRRNNREIDFSQGIGSRLNNQMKKLAFFAIPPPTTHNAGDSPTLRAPFQDDEKLNRIDRRIVFRVLYHVAQVLTLSADLLNRVQGSISRKKLA